MALRFYYILLICIYFSIFSFGAARAEDQSLGNRELEMAQQMGQMYGQYLFNSHCMKNFHFYLADKEGNLPSLADPAVAKRLADGCACMSKVAGESNSSNAIIRYVMTMEAKSPPVAASQGPAAIENYFRANGIDRVADIVDNENIRKKCGFFR